MSSAPPQPEREPRDSEGGGYSREASGGRPREPDVAAVAKEIERMRQEKAGIHSATGSQAVPRAEPSPAKKTGSGKEEPVGRGAAQQIDAIRSQRGRREKNLSIGALVSAISKKRDRTYRKLGSLITLWEELVPEALASSSRLSELRGGVLHVEVESSAACFELDRLLRGGLEAELRRRFRGTLTKVRLRVGELDRA